MRTQKVHPFRFGLQPMWLDLCLYCPPRLSERTLSHLRHPASAPGTKQGVRVGLLLRLVLTTQPDTARHQSRPSRESSLSVVALLLVSAATLQVADAASGFSKRSGL